MKFNALLWIVAIAAAVALSIALRPAAKAIDIDMKPVACYSVEGEVVKNGTHFGLIFNQCESSFRWVVVPDPPERIS